MINNSSNKQICWIHHQKKKKKIVEFSHVRHVLQACQDHIHCIQNWNLDPPELVISLFCFCTTFTLNFQFPPNGTSLWKSQFSLHAFLALKSNKFKSKAKPKIHSFIYAIFFHHKPNQHTNLLLSKFKFKFKWLLPWVLALLTLTHHPARSISLWVPCSLAKRHHFFVVLSPRLITAGTHRSLLHSFLFLVLIK